MPADIDRHADEGPARQVEWLRVTLSSLSDAVITTDPMGLVTLLNPIAGSLTGWTQDEAVGRPLESVFQILNEQNRQPIESPGLQALREDRGVEPTNHVLLIAKDGTERTIDQSVSPIRHDGGQIAGVVVVFRDVSERRQHEKALQKALTYTSEIIATLREPFLVLDQDLRVKTANSAFYEHFHVVKEETEGQFLFELGNGQWDNPRLRTLLHDVIPANHPINDYEVEHIFLAIGPRIMLLNARRFPPHGENTELILLAIEDVTERRRMETALRVSEVRYRRLFQTAKDGILILDADTGKITDSNPFMSGLLGYELDEFLGKELWQIGLFRDIEVNQAAYRELLAYGYVRYDHLPLETKAGRKAEVEFVSNVYEASGKSVIQCNIRDITERTELERQAREQTEALADLHRRKDEFLAMLSHELRNPLAPILNAVQLLRLTGGEDLTLRQARTIIERQVAQLARLVDDLLEVSRISSGRMRFQDERLDMRIVVDRAVEVARPLIDKRRHDLSVSLPTEPVWLHADASRLEQVVVNLLNNAAKYTDEGGSIGVTVREEGAQAVLRVRDTGQGIHPELLPRIFDLFTQADRTLDRSQGGLGIGLSLVQRIVEMQRGTVEVESAGVGRGSEFTVRLPVVLSPAPTSALSTPRPAARPDRGVRVLVVDDNVDAAESMALLLRVSGYDVQTAHTGPTGVETASAYLPNIVLLDIGLPGLNGYEVARSLRRNPQLKDTRLIALTGYGRESDVQLGEEAGFDAHLIKPVDLKTVLELITSL